jgi:hypothetical protein
MQIKPQSLNIFAIFTGIVVAAALTGYLALAVFPFWEAMPFSPALMVAGWTMVTLALVVLFFALMLAVRLTVLAATATYLRGKYAFLWLPASHAPQAHASPAYAEWSYVRNGAPQMGLRIGRLQIVLLGVPQSFPATAG